MTTLSEHEFLRTSPEHFPPGRPRVVRIQSARASRATGRTPDRIARAERDKIWLVAASVAGIILSFVLGGAFLSLDLGEDVDALITTIAETTSPPPPFVPAGPAAQPTFHEQFKLHPTEGDVEEQVATF